MNVNKTVIGITQKLRKGEQFFSCGTHCLDLILIPIKFHEDMKIVYGQHHAIMPPFFFKRHV